MNKNAGHRALLGALCLTQIVCHQAIPTAPDANITLVANPEFIATDGDVSVISALLIEPAGTPVPDGTVVQFFTNLGRIQEQGRTNDGVARVNLISDTRSGVATVTATSGSDAAGPGPSPSPSTGNTVSAASAGAAVVAAAGASATVQVTIGGGQPDSMVMAANPARIRAGDPRRSEISAFVSDADGNVLKNIRVFFSVEGTPSTEFMESGGAPLFTDSNGRAIDTLRTRLSPTADPKTVTVLAITANGITGKRPGGTDGVQVTIN